MVAVRISWAVRWANARAAAWWRSEFRPRRASYIATHFRRSVRTAGTGGARVALRMSSKPCRRHHKCALNGATAALPGWHTVVHHPATTCAHAWLARFSMQRHTQARACPLVWAGAPVGECTCVGVSAVCMGRCGRGVRGLSSGNQEVLDGYSKLPHGLLTRRRQCRIGRGRERHCAGARSATDRADGCEDQPEYR